MRVFAGRCLPTFITYGSVILQIHYNAVIIYYGLILSVNSFCSFC